MKVFLYCFLISFSACTPGFIYTDITRPECVDMRNTNSGFKSAAGNTKRLEIPTTRIDITAEWSSRAIGDIAKANNINTVLYCDKSTFSLLGGIYKKQEIIIYGE